MTIKVKTKLVNVVYDDQQHPKNSDVIIKIVESVIDEAIKAHDKIKL